MKDQAASTFEHILPLPVQKTRPRLQFLRPQKLRNRNSLRIGGIRRIQRNLGTALCRLLCLTLALSLSCYSSCSQLRDVLFGRHPLLRGICIQLFPLLFGEFSRRYSSLRGFGCDLLLEGSELLGIGWCCHFAGRITGRQSEPETV